MCFLNGSYFLWQVRALNWVHVQPGGWCSGLNESLVSSPSSLVVVVLQVNFFHCIYSRGRARGGHHKLIMQVFPYGRILEGGGNTINLNVNHQHNYQRRSSWCWSRAFWVKTNGLACSRSWLQVAEWSLFTVFEMFLVLMYVFDGLHAGVETDLVKFAKLIQAVNLAVWRW